MIVRDRLPPDVFRLPVEKIRSGYKSDIYFNRTKYVLERDGLRRAVTMQVFQKRANATVVGTDHTLAILHVGTGHYRDRVKAQRLFERYLENERALYRAWSALPKLDWRTYEPVARQVFDTSRALAELWLPAWRELEVRSLFDGETSQSHEPVMHIEGDYSGFAHLETLYLGALADGTKVASNTRAVVEAANGKPVIMFGARHQSHEAQAGSGYAAHVGGAIGVSTDEQGEWWGSQGLGTIPHALIAAYGGDTVLATLKFDEHINRSDEALAHLTARDHPERHVSVTALVDFTNDVVGTSLQVAKALGAKLWGVRVDTAEDLIDASVLEELRLARGQARGELTGVTPRLVEILRGALDRNGYRQVKIVASGGFDAGKIRRFEELGVPVDVYGVGSELLHAGGSAYDYTADIVRVEGRPLAKVGRVDVENPRLERVDWIKLTGAPTPEQTVTGPA
jgi:nicotinate phosphoribosyltransferase